MAFILDTEKQILNTIALRGIVIFPGTTASFEIGRKISINALKSAENNDEPLFLVTQEDPSITDPKPDDLMKTGVVARILHSARLKDGSIQVVVEGIRRAQRGETVITDDVICCEIVERKSRRNSSFAQERIATKELFEIFTEYLNYIAKPSEEIVEEVNKLRDSSHIADFLASNFIVNFDERKSLLEEYDTTKRIR